MIPPVLGRRSPAAGALARLRDTGEPASAAYRADGGDGAWCALRAASVAGVRHRLAGQSADDSYCWSFGEGALVVAVADGLGSVPGSARAAADAAAAAVTAAAAAAVAAPEQALDDAVGAANEAARGGGATTVAVAVVHPDGRVWLARVGDSTALVLSAEAGWVESFDPPSGDDVVGAPTAALPSPDPEPEHAAVTLGPAQVLVLATDGIADPLRDGPATVAPALAGGLLRPPSPLELAALADFSRQGCHDDRTVVAVWLER